MISIALLVAWMASGALVALTARPSGDSQTAWLPIAVIFGPLWAAVSTDLSGDYEPEAQSALVLERETARVPVSGAVAVS